MLSAAAERVAAEELTFCVSGLVAVAGFYRAKAQSRSEKKKQGFECLRQCARSEAHPKQPHAPCSVKPASPSSLSGFAPLRDKNLFCCNAQPDTPPEPDAQPPTHGVALAPQSP
jgi:hypothetical protein